MMAQKPIPTAHQFRLLIAGSRDATPAMLKTAYKAVARAKANGWAILVGDAVGVDAAVAEACNRLGVNYTCVGISATPRHHRVMSVQAGGTGRYVRFEARGKSAYTARDRYLVDLADRVLCLWNGESKGTAAVAEYTRQLGKPVDVLTHAKKTPASHITKR